MIEWFPQFFSNTSPVTCFGSELPDSDDCIVLMQFTGLLDKNGVEIYEGDILDEGGIVSFGYYDEGEYEQRSSGYGWYISYGAPPNDAGYPISWKDGDGANGHTVIGNIHQNPELLIK